MSLRAGEIWFGPCSVKGSRPYCVLIPDASPPGDVAVVCLVTSEKTTAYFPGSVQIPAVSGLTKASLLAPILSHFEPGVLTLPRRLRSPEPIPVDLHRAVVAMVLASFAEQESSSYHPLYSRLPPPSRRGRPRASEDLSQERERLRMNFEVLQRCRWRPPPRGSLLRFPPWFRDPLTQDWLVLSSNSFNTRYPYPKVHVAPIVTATRMLALPGSPGTSSGIALGKLPAVGLDAECYAMINHLDTFDYSSSYLGECGKGHFWRVPKSHPRTAGVCIACNESATVDLPKVLVDATLVVAADRVTDALRTRLFAECRASQPEMRVVK